MVFTVNIDTTEHEHRLNQVQYAVSTFHCKDHFLYLVAYTEINRPPVLASDHLAIFQGYISQPCKFFILFHLIFKGACCQILK